MFCYNIKFDKELKVGGFHTTNNSRLPQIRFGGGCGIRPNFTTGNYMALGQWCITCRKIGIRSGKSRTSGRDVGPNLKIDENPVRILISPLIMKCAYCRAMNEPPPIALQLTM